MSQINDFSFGSQILEKYFNYPVLALLSHLLLFTFSMVATHLLLAIIYVVTKSRTATIFTMILTGLWVIGSGKYLPDSLYPLNYISLPIGINNNSFVVFIAVGTVLLLSIVLISQIDYNFQHVWSFFKGKGTLLIFLLLISAILWKGTSVHGTQTIGDKFFYIFFGGSIEGFNFFNFLSYFILYFGFVYVVQLHLQKVLSQISHYMIIRYKSINRWFWQWYRKVAFSILVYLTILALTSFIIGRLVGGTLGFSTTFESSFSTFDQYYQFFVNGYLQITFYVLLVFMISWLTAEPFYSLVAIGILSIFMFPGLNLIKVLPVGLNSLGYLTGHFTTYTISLLLLLYILLEVGILIYLLNRKDINL
ncbi:permease [Bacillus sp. B15-48]|uniref:permease n=1 Tax=Bacillus sp. B15-48 TaxID=1548601 RepID=UPI00193F8C2A|nr:permease [Bacillus sp. B15-48]MBM4763483.1 permease [Bacillus sp. B15-48]